MKKIFIILIVCFLIFPVATFSQIKNVKKKSAIELNRQALDFFNSGLWKRATDNITRALEIEPDNKSIRYNYALMLFKMKKFVLSKKECIKILKKYPEDNKVTSLYIAAINGIKKTPGGDDPELMGDIPGKYSEKDLNNGGRVPQIVKDLLESSFITRDFEYVWDNLALEVKNAKPKEQFVRTSNLLAKQESQFGKNLKIIINSFQVKHKFAIAYFSLISEKYAGDDIKQIIGGDATYIEKDNNYQFFKYENGNWKLYPISFFSKTLSNMFFTFRKIFTRTSEQIKFKGNWFDKNLFILDRFEKFWRRKDALKSNNARIMKKTYEYFVLLKLEKYEKAFQLLASYSKNTMKIPDLRDFFLYSNIYQINIGNVKFNHNYAQCEFVIQNLNYDYSKGSIKLTRLNSFLWLSYEDTEWRVIDYTQKKKFWDRNKRFLTDFNYVEDQYATFNGRDWIDATAQYRKKLKDEFEGK